MYCFDEQFVYKMMPCLIEFQFDDEEDDLQIIEVKEDPIDVSDFPMKKNPESTNGT